MEINITKEDGGSAVHCLSLALHHRVLLRKVSNRVWALIPQQWENAAGQSGPEIDRQKSQAQALVHAGAWLAGLGGPTHHPRRTV